ncbi:hypothetical protein [Nocardioides sp.]|uniref:hypothetical protein n=1 Tax=Nocardioides sp. TaxID=35761 RepID=UPI003D1258C1
MVVLSLVLLVLALAAVLVGWLSPRRGPGLVGVGLAGALLTVVAAIGVVHDPSGPPAPWLRLLLLAATSLLAVGGGGPLTAAVFGLVDGRDRPRADQGSARGSMEEAGQVLRGGAWIGVLERAAVFATLMAGWPEGLAVVLGLKGLGRYPELRSGHNSGTAERFIIGTFTSALWAAACAGAVLLLL